MKSNSYCGFFINFANKTKMAIVASLIYGPLNTSEIVKIINEEQSKVSHNLRKLTHCHILNVKRVGKNRVYSVNEETVVPMLKIVEKHVGHYCKEKRCIK